MHGLLIKSPWIDEILQGHKTWEIRGSNTNVRGTIALIRSGSGKIVGTCELVDVVGPLTLSDMYENVDKHSIPINKLEGNPLYNKTYAWVLKNVNPFEQPNSYKHPNGAVIWVKLPEHA